MTQLVALFDFGSNAVRFTLARVKRGSRIRVLREHRAQTRLGGGRPGSLPAAAIDDTLRAVRRFLREVRRYHAKFEDDPLKIIAVATSAVREADNRERLLGPLRREQGIDVRILTGAEEARLGATAVIDDVPGFDGVVADLGGGSLQLTAVRRGRILTASSVPIGTVRMTRAHLRSDPPEPRELRALRADIRSRLEPVLPIPRRGDAVVGLGGTIRTLARMRLTAHRGRRRDRQGMRLGQPDVTAIRIALERLSVRERRHLRGLKAERTDTILAGAILVEELLIYGGYPRLIVSTRGVRDGLLLHEALGSGR